MYFISKNNKKDGPYTLDEVLAMRLTDDIFIWKEGISWTKVSELPELRDVVIKTPPPLPHEILYLKEKESKKQIIELRREKSVPIIKNSLLNGALISLIITFILAAIAESGGSSEYAIFHSSGRETFGDFFWPFFIRILIIIEPVALIVAGAKIAKLKPGSNYRNNGSNRKSIFSLLGSIVHFLSK